MKKVRTPRTKWKLKRNWPLHLMVAPALLLLLLFSYAPMPGIVMAFQDYKPWLGFANSEWVGIRHFTTIFTLGKPVQVILNTLVISVYKMVFGLLVPVLFAVLLNEIRRMWLKRSIQTLVYLPHFLSWVILGGILIDLLSVEGGLVNQTLHALFGWRPIFFLGDGDWFRFSVIVSDIWKEFGFSTIIFLAALSSINPEMYEAALIDGANRFKMAIHITLPSMTAIVIVVATLSLGNVLNANFDQIFNLYNPLVMDKGDIIDTYVYREGLLGAKFSFSAAVGLFKSVVGLVLILAGYRLAYRFANYRIF